MNFEWDPNKAQSNLEWLIARRDRHGGPGGLGWSRAGITAPIEHIYKKLEVRSRTAAVLQALEKLGMVQPE